MWGYLLIVIWPRYAMVSFHIQDLIMSVSAYQQGKTIVIRITKFTFYFEFQSCDYMAVTMNLV